MQSTFNKLQPMLLKSTTPFNSDNHIFEIKLDGYRCLALLTKQKCLFKSRNNLPFNYPNLQALGNQIREDCIVDGELVALVDKKQNRHALKNKNTTPIYVVFDIIYLNGKSLTNTPLLKRKEILFNNIVPNNTIILCQHTHFNGIQLFAQAYANGLEGIVAKHINGLYYPNKRTNDWQKIRCDTIKL